MSDAAKPCPWSLSTESIGDRIVYTHSHAPTHPGSNYSASGSSNSSNSNSGGVGSGGGRAVAGRGVSNPTTTGGTYRTSKGTVSATRDDRGGGFGGGDNTRTEVSSPVAGGVSSYALVTILSEPLDLRIDAMLIQPPPQCQEGAVQVSDKTTLMSETVLTTAPGGKKTGSGTEAKRSSSGLDIGAEGVGLSQSIGVGVILGPVVGKVGVVLQSGVVRESCHVPVVLEVDGDGSVTCVVSLPPYPTRGASMFSLLRKSLEKIERIPK